MHALVVCEDEDIQIIMMGTIFHKLFIRFKFFCQFW